MQWFVDAEDLLEAIGEEYNKEENEDVRCGLNLARYCVKCATNPLEAQDIIQMSWVSVKDRLPEPDSYCITWSPKAGFNVLKYQYLSRNKGLLGFWRTEEGGCRYVEPGEVTHWMPLPEPPSGTK